MKTIKASNRKYEEKIRSPWLSDESLKLVLQKKELYKSMRKRKQADVLYIELKKKNQKNQLPTSKKH
jgi:flagellar basal body L-ring protein FlgH